MNIRVLGCSGAIAKGCRTTSFLVDDNVLIDAGTGVGDLTLDEMRRINYVFLTHSHMDHIAALPLMLDSVGSLRTRPVQVHALAETIDALRRHVFNDVIWPDFEVLPSPAAPYVEFLPFARGEVVRVGDLHVEALPASHTVPAVGFALSIGGPCWVFSGDTEDCPAFWDRVNALDVSALVIETAFTNADEGVARASKHLWSCALSAALQRLRQSSAFPIYVTHTKPVDALDIQQEVAAAVTGARFDIHWLERSHQFNLRGGM